MLFSPKMECQTFNNPEIIVGSHSRQIKGFMRGGIGCFYTN